MRALSPIQPSVLLYLLCLSGCVSWSVHSADVAALWARTDTLARRSDQVGQRSSHDAEVLAVRLARVERQLAEVRDAASGAARTAEQRQAQQRTRTLQLLRIVSTLQRRIDALEVRQREGFDTLRDEIASALRDGAALPTVVVSIRTDPIPPEAAEWAVSQVEQHLVSSASAATSVCSQIIRAGIAEIPAALNLLGRGPNIPVRIAMAILSAMAGASLADLIGPLIETSCDMALGGT